jgi:hypothetical protein
MAHLHRILSCSILAAGCGDAAVLQPDARDVVAIDAPADGANGSGSLVGTWRRLDPQTTHTLVPERETLTLMADGTMRDETQGQATVTGTWTADELSLTLPNTGFQPATETATTNYVVTGDSLVTCAVLPQGAITGPVGEWRGRRIVDGYDFQETIVLRADMTATWTLADTGGGNATVHEGMWKRAAGDIMFYDESPAGAFIVGELPGLALGHVWERVSSAPATSGR